MNSTAKILYRFALGRPLSGEAKTNATFFRRADKITHHSGRAGRWSHLPHAHRAGYRLGALSIAVAGTYGEIADPFLTDVAAGGAGALGALYGGSRAVRAVRRRRHHRRWVRPLHRAMATSALTPVSHRDSPYDYLTVPVDYAVNDESEIRLNLPEGFAGDRTVKAEMERIICEKLGITDAVVKWRIAGREPYMTVQIAPRPPKRVTWDDALQLIKAAPESAPIIGLGNRGAVVSVNLDDEAPHVLVSASSGGGKSVT